MALTEQRREEIREELISCLNGMGSRFFYRELSFDTPEEAVYCASLWGGAKRLPPTYLKVGIWPKEIKKDHNSQT